MFQGNRLHWSLSLIKSSQQRLILIFEEYKNSVKNQVYKKIGQMPNLIRLY
ncbi:hypothetical protein YB51_7530 [Streptococcus suis YB51]|nr:hypothetical protein YB51_7530 [Streptococcus suis YB51]